MAQCISLNSEINLLSGIPLRIAQATAKFRAHNKIQSFEVLKLFSSCSSIKLNVQIHLKKMMHKKLCYHTTVTCR